MAGGGAGGANCYCHNLWMFVVGDPVNMDIRQEADRNGQLYQCHLENRRGSLDREVQGKKF